MRLAPLDYRSIEAMTQSHEFGLRPPDKAAINKANPIIANTPAGPTPFEVAKSFVTRFGKSDPDGISQVRRPRDAHHTANERHEVSLRPPIVRGLSLLKQSRRET